MRLSTICGERVIDQLQQFLPVASTGSRKPFEIVFQSHVREHLIAVFVKVEKGTTAAVERAARLFLQRRALADFIEQQSDPVECGLRRMLNCAIGTELLKNGKSATLSVTAMLSAPWSRDSRVPG